MHVSVDSAYTNALSLERCSHPPETRFVPRAKQYPRGGTRTFVDLCQAGC
jgi:hypothetical protein